MYFSELTLCAFEQAHSRLISENVTFTNDDVMNDVIGALH